MWFMTSWAACAAAAIGWADVSVPKNAYCRNLPHDRVERVVHRHVHHRPSARVRERIGDRRVHRARVVFGQLAPANHDRGVGELV